MDEIYQAALDHFRQVDASAKFVAVWLEDLHTELVVHDGGLQNLTAYVSAAADYLKSLES